MRSYLERRELITEAMQIAMDKVKGNTTRTVMVLFPNTDWTRDVMDCLDNMQCVAPCLHPMPGVFIRYSDNKASLKALPVDCLILVDPDNPEFDEQGTA